jgi:hypothetical protein
MKYEILKWTIEGHKVWEIIHLDERLGNAYWPKYLKPLEKPSIINQIKDFTNIKNKALKPNKKGRK